MPRPVPTYDREAAHGGLVAGVDEVGRGPLAGPVVAAAVILDPNRIPSGLADSKALSAARRESLAAELQACARIGLGAASVGEIDRINILQATYLAMTRAVTALGVSPDLVLVDGNRAPSWTWATQTIVKGDAHCLSIAAASIVAKVCRDRLMTRLDARHPGFGWSQNAGYGTESHRIALARLGPTRHHRLSFVPIAQFAKAAG